MKNTFHLLLLFITFSAFSQHKAIEITNIKTGKTKVFEENQRIKLRTLDGKKRIGNLSFANNETLIINKNEIKIDSVQSIKNQPKTLATIKTIILGTGLAVVGSSLISAANGNNSAFLLFTIGSGISIGSGLIDVTNSNNSNRNWKFKIIEKQ